MFAYAAYVTYVLLVAIGLFVVVDDDHLVKKVVGLNVFQVGVFLFYVTAGYRSGGRPPLVESGGGPYVDPLPQVLVLTAIVVGVSVSALALAIVIRIYREYDTLSERELREVLEK